MGNETDETPDAKKRKGDALVPSADAAPVVHGTAVDKPGTLGASISGEVHGFKWDVRATGLAAAVVLGAGAVLLILFFGDPMQKPAHFMAALFSAYVAGIMTNAIVSHARLSDALKDKETYRRELDRVADAKRKCEEMLVKYRRSSAPPAPKRKGGR